MSATAAQRADYLVVGAGSAGCVQAVANAQCRVRGVGELRLVDASAMPPIIGGNTDAPVIMTAEEAADLRLGRGAPGSMRG